MTDEFPLADYPNPVITVTIIDDDVTLLEALSRTLQQEGFKVTTASSPVEGVQMAATLKPEIIICDVNMPGHSGHWVLGQIRSNPATADIPLIFLTGETSPSDVRQGMNLGADDYLCKPVQPIDLIDALRTRVAKRRAQRTREATRSREWATQLSRIISHEIRTPLGVIGPGIELLDDAVTASDTEEIQTVSRIVKDGATRLLATTERLEIFAALATAAAGPSSHPTPRNKACHGQALHDLFMNIAGKWKRTGDIRIEGMPAELPVDFELFEILLRELVDNALKFSPPASPVVVRLSHAEGNIHLQIQDGGRGMEPWQIQAASAFQQFDRLQREQQGLGLGLAICHLLIQRMDGKITFHRPQSGGLIVDVVLPGIAPSDGKEQSMP